MESSVGQLELALLRARLHLFERHFYRVAGPRYAELDQARAQAAQLRARFIPASRRESAEALEMAKAFAEESAAVLTQPRTEPDKLKHLHRHLARLFHPDLASDHARRVVRDKLMTEVNLAFREEDLRRLELLSGALDHDENGDAARQLAHLSLTPVNELRERAEYALRQGHDLLLDLTGYLARRTEDVKLRGARVPPANGARTTLVQRALSDLSAVNACRRLLSLPSTSMGEISMRAERDIDSPLKLVGEAKGTVVVPFGRSAILRLKTGCHDLSALQNLDQDDLHGIVDEWPDFVDLTDEQLQPLAHFHGLEVIQLGRTKITGRVFDRFPSLRELRIFNVEETEFDDGGLLRLEECVWMQRLDLTSTRVTGPGLQGIRDMTALRALSLCGISVADADLAVLGRVPGLRELNLALTQVSDQCATHLAQLRCLEVLNLGGTAITDAILAPMATLPLLRELVLWETAITDAGLLTLTSFPALRYLDVDQTNVSHEALIAFRALCPAVRLPSDIWAKPPNPSQKLITKSIKMW